MKKGFTLVELLVVIAIIGVLAGLAVPQYLGAVKNAKIAKAKNAMGIISKAEKMYCADPNGGNGMYTRIANKAGLVVLEPYTEMTQIQNDPDWNYRVAGGGDGGDMSHFMIVAVTISADYYIALTDDGEWEEGVGEGP